MPTKREEAAAVARKATATRRKRRDPLVRAEQQNQIVQGMVAGLSLDEIARVTGLSDATVKRERKRLIEQRVDERDSSIAQLRERELLSLDRLQRAHWQQACSGHIASSRIVLDCIKQRSKMLGLEAPVQIDVQQRSQLDAEIEQLVDELTTMGLVK